MYVIDADTTKVLPVNNVIDMAYDEKLDSLYVVTNGGLSIVNLVSSPTLSSQIYIKSERPVRMKSVGKLDGSENIFVGTNHGIFRVNADGTTHRVDDRDVANTGTVHEIKTFDELTLYFCTDMGVFTTRDGFQFDKMNTSSGTRNQETIVRTMDNRFVDNFVTGGIKGVFHTSPKETQNLTENEGMPSNWITALCFDKIVKLKDEEKNGLKGLWVGTKTKGLAVNFDGSWNEVSKRVNLITSDKIADIISIENKVFVSTKDGGLNLYTKKRWTDRTKLQNVTGKGAPPQTLCFAARDNTVYAGTVSGIYVIEKGIIIHHYKSTTSKITDNYIIDLEFDDKDILWVATKDHGLCGLDIQKDEWIVPELQEYLPSKSITKLYMEPGRGIYFLMDKVKGKIHEKIGRINEKFEAVPLVSKEVSRDYRYDETLITLDTPTAIYSTPEFKYVGTSGFKQPMLKFTKGIWKVEKDYNSTTPITEIVPGNGNDLLIGTDDGLVIKNDNGYKKIDMLAPIKVVDAIVPDSKNPDAYFIASNFRNTPSMIAPAWLIYYDSTSNKIPDYLKFLSFINDVIQTENYIYIGVDNHKHGCILYLKDKTNEIE